MFCGFCYLTVDCATPLSQNGASNFYVFQNRAGGWTVLFLNTWMLQSLELLHDFSNKLSHHNKTNNG